MLTGFFSKIISDDRGLSSPAENLREDGVEKFAKNKFAKCFFRMACDRTKGNTEKGYDLAFLSCLAIISEKIHFVPLRANFFSRFFRV